MRRWTVLVLFGWMALTSGREARAQAAGDAEAIAMAAAHRPNTAYTLPPEKLAMAIAYSHERTLLELLGEGWQMLALLGLLATGAAARMRDIAAGVSRNRWAQGFLFTFLLLLTVSLAMLPIGLVGHHLAVRYGQSVQPWGSWFGDLAKSFVLRWWIGGLLGMLLLFVIRRSPTRWWFWFWVPAMGCVLFGVLAAPVLVDPLFNRFEPLARVDPALVERLEQVVRRGGIEIPPSRMFLMRASDKVTGLNAYVTGIGASKRVVVWDTTIAHATPDEIALIFGHEMGHYALDHIWKGLAFTAVLSLMLFFVAFHAMRRLIARFGRRWGVPAEHDWAAVPVLALVLLALNFLSEPLDNAVSRAQEHAADVYGQEAVHGIVADPRTVGQHSFEALGAQSLDEPHPSALVVLWTYSHPPIGERAAFAAAYDPWAPGMRPRYFRR